MFRFRRHRFQVDPQTFRFAVKRVTADAEQLGSTQFVAARIPQRCQNMLAFDLSKRLRQFAHPGVGRLLGRRLSQPGRNAKRANEGRWCELSEVIRKQTSPDIERDRALNAIATLDANLTVVRTPGWCRLCSKKNRAVLTLA